MSEPTASPSPASAPATPAAPAKGSSGGSKSPADLVQAAYDMMATGVDPDDEGGGGDMVVEDAAPAGEATTEETTAEEPAKAEPEKSQDSKGEEAPPKATEQEIAEAVAEIEAAKKDLLEHREKLVKSFGQLKHREHQIEKKSQALKQQQEAFAQEKKTFETRQSEWMADVKMLIEGNADQKIRALHKIGGGQDIAEFITGINESVTGVQPAERAARKEIAELKQTIAEFMEAQRTQKTETEKTRQKAAEEAAYQQQVEKGYSHVRQQLGHLVQNAEQYKFSALAEVSKLAGERVAYQLLQDVGESLAKRGHQYPFEDAAFHIANECHHFLTRTAAGEQYLQGLRARAGKATPQTQPQSDTGVRQASPGTSLSAAAASAPGPTRSDLSQQEDAMARIRTLRDEEFAEQFLPSDVRVA